MMQVETKRRDILNDTTAALAQLLHYCVSGRRYEQTNPYAHIEIVNALKVIAKERGISDYLEALSGIEDTGPALQKAERIHQERRYRAGVTEARLAQLRRSYQ